MNLNYSQTLGVVTDNDGGFIAKGWAGKGEGKNNPAMQHIHCVGPLPQGVYKMSPWSADGVKMPGHESVGPMVTMLTQISGETYEREGFFIHGPAVGRASYGQESKGCIVIPHNQRLVVRALTLGPDDTVTVTA